jgi:RNA polymerase sigma-70 factor (ECF subfamily)
MTSEDSRIERLVEQLREGDDQALAELFLHYRDKLWRMVNFRLDQRLTGRVDADDVLQESYMAAAQRVEHFCKETDMSILVWLRLIVAQTLVDVHRRHLGARMRDARQEVSLHVSPAQATSISLAAHLLGHLTSPSQAAMRAEMTRRLEDALRSMDPIDREVLALRHFEELTNNEVAEVLGLQKSAASNRYVRALTRLKSILAVTPGFPGAGDSVG